jgi:hypothetical protein
MSKGRIFAAVGALVAAVAVGAVVTYLAVRPVSSPVSPASDATLTINNDFSGSVDLLDDVSCQGGGGYSDLVPGTAVTVSDSTGHVIATGALNTGSQTKTSLSGTLNGTQDVASACVIGFNVNDVPDNLKSYVVTISHRGSQVISPSEAHSGVQLTIG